MAEELGKIERPAVDEFKKGRKLYFVPLVVSIGESDIELDMKVGKYWDQVESQLLSLETKLGEVSCIFHEMVPQSGEDGTKTIAAISNDALRLARTRMDKGAKLEAIEDTDVLLEFMDWGRCLNVGLQSQQVFNTVYDSYNKTLKLRNDTIAKRIDEALANNESAVLIMREGHGIQFAADIQVIYVAPPALDELKRWIREREAGKVEEDSPGSGKTEDKQDEAKQ